MANLLNDPENSSPAPIDPLGVELTQRNAREQLLKLIGDMDRVAESAMNGLGLDPRVRLLLESAPELIDTDAFKRKLGFALASHAVFIAESDPDAAAELLSNAVNVLGPRSSSAALVATGSHKKALSRAILGALGYSAKKSKSHGGLAAHAHDLLDEIDHEDDAKKSRDATLGAGSFLSSILDAGDSEPGEPQAGEALGGLSHLADEIGAVDLSSKRASDDALSALPQKLIETRLTGDEPEKALSAWVQKPSPKTNV